MDVQNRPLISVIVPIYNIMEYLPRCVDSICKQTYENLEILLVDDGSTDGTGKLCDELAVKDSRIKVFHKENGGSSSARNLALEHAKGAYIGFVDSDDYIEADMYERLYQGLSSCRKDGFQMAQIGRDEMDEQGNLMADICTPPEEPEAVSAEDFLRELLMHRGDCSFCTKLVDRKLFAGKGFPVGVLNEDFHLLVEMLQEAKGVLSLPGYGYHVFYRIGSNSRKADKEQFSRVFGDCVDNADLVQKLVACSYPELKQVALRFAVFQRLEYLLHIPVSQMDCENSQYRQIVSWMRRNLCRGLCNPYLTGKNKVYHLLLAIAPKGIRKIHKKLRRI